MEGRRKKLKEDLQQRSTFYKVSLMNTIYPDKKKENSNTVKSSSNSSVVKSSSIAKAFKLSRPKSSNPRDLNLNLMNGSDSAGSLASSSSSAVAPPSKGICENNFSFFLPLIF